MVQRTSPPPDISFEIDESHRSRSTFKFLFLKRAEIESLVAKFANRSFVPPAANFTGDDFPYGGTSAWKWGYDSFDVPTLTTFLYLRSVGMIHPHSRGGFLPRPTPWSVPGNKTIFIGGLNGCLSRDGIIWVCRFFGDVHPNVKWQPSHAIVTFATKDAAERALSHLQGFVLRGIELRVNYASVRGDRNIPGATRPPVSIATPPQPPISTTARLHPPRLENQSQDHVVRLHSEFLGELVVHLQPSSFQRPAPTRQPQGAQSPRDESWAGDAPDEDGDGLLNTLSANGDDGGGSASRSITHGLCLSGDPIIPLAFARDRSDLGPICRPAKVVV
ncbi:hypothetical protein I317_07291 [Kwoniella heveanensis CBS 569]|nr:hypothetical protein I317_07291 [Kwoniella heveanensis CBS 569]